jgi:hypothetical protein
LTNRPPVCLWVLFVALLFTTIAGPQAAAADVEFRGSLSGTILVQEDQGVDFEQMSFLGSLIGSGWQTSVRASLQHGVFSYLAFADLRRLGPLDLQTLTVFNPSASAFQYMNSIVRFTAWDVDVQNSAFLSNSPSQSYDQLAVTGASGTVFWRGETNVSLCPFEFRSASFQASSTWPSCGLQWRSTIAFSQITGFDYLILSATYPRVPFLSFGILETDLILTLGFNLQGKRVTPELRTRVLNATACFTPLLELETTGDPLTIVGIVAYGLRLECSLGDSVSLYAATSLNPSRNYELTGYPEFFETLQFRVPLQGCCDRDGFTEIGVFFDQGSSSLMDWGLLKASIDVPFGRRLKLTLGIEHRPKAPHWTFRIGGEVVF